MRPGRRLPPASPVRLLVLAALLSFAGCGDEPPDAPPRTEPPWPLALPEPKPLSRLERLHLRIRTCVAVGGPGAEAQIREVAREILETCDPDDPEARRLLGYTDFQADVLGRTLERGEDPIPEAIANRQGYDFLEEVREFHRRRWLRDPEEIAHAREVVAAMREHARRLVEDRLYRLGDAARANLATDPHLGDYVYATAWRPPFLVCFARGEEVSDFDLLKVPDWNRRRKIREEVRLRREALRPSAEAVARTLSWLDGEFRRRWGDRHGLRPLDAPWGGRPDYRPGVRSYADGVPLLVVVFDSERSYREFHIVHCGGPRRTQDLGYYLPTDGRVYMFDPGGDEAEHATLVRTLLRLGTYQLLAAYARQKNRWGAPSWGHEFFGAGLAGWWSGVRIGKEDALEFTGLNVDLLGGAQELAAALSTRELAYPLRPLRELVGITRYTELASQPREERGEPFFGAVSDAIPSDGDLVLYFQQAWMFVLFLQEYDGGRYREGFERYLEAYLSRETQFGMAQQVFKRCLDLEEPDLERLDAEFRTFVEEDLLKREP